MTGPLSTPAHPSPSSGFFSPLFSSYSSPPQLPPYSGMSQQGHGQGFGSPLALSQEVCDDGDDCGGGDGGDEDDCCRECDHDQVGMYHTISGSHYLNITITSLHLIRVYSLRLTRIVTTTKVQPRELQGGKRDWWGASALLPPFHHRFIPHPSLPMKVSPTLLFISPLFSSLTLPHPCKTIQLVS